MAQKKKTTAKKPRVSKLNLWLSHYLNAENPQTFLNKTESTRAAGYQCKNDDSFRQVGCQNFTKLTEKITEWLDETGLSENVLKIKLLKLMEAKETKFQTMKGAVNPESLPECVKVLAVTGIIETLEDGGRDYGTGDTLLAIETENLELQRRTLDMGIKVKGLYAAEKKELSGPGGKPIKIESDLSPEAEQKLAELINGPAGA